MTSRERKLADTIVYRLAGARIRARLVRRTPDGLRLEVEPIAFVDAAGEHPMLGTGGRVHIKLSDVEGQASTSFH